MTATEALLAGMVNDTICSSAARSKPNVIAARAADYRSLMDAMHRGEVPEPFDTMW